MPDSAQRRDWYRTLTSTPAALLAPALHALQPLPEHHWLHPPQTASLSVPARMDSRGHVFELCEVLVTRSTVALATGEVGLGYVLGRDRVRSQQVALLDALAAADPHRLGPMIARLAAAVAAARQQHRAAVAATTVDFFTLVRGEP